MGTNRNFKDFFYDVITTKLSFFYFGEKPSYFDTNSLNNLMAANPH